VRFPGKIKAKAMPKKATLQKKNDIPDHSAPASSPHLQNLPILQRGKDLTSKKSVRHTKRRRPHSKLRTCFETLMPPGQPMMIEPKILPIFSGFQDQRGNWNAAILLTANASTPCTGATAVDMHTALTADLTARHVITTSAINQLFIRNRRAACA